MKKLKVLVIQSDKENLKLIVDTLDGQYDIKIAHDGTNGVFFHKEFNPDIIITDINIPKMNGIDMISKIRKIDKNVKIIVLTEFQDIDCLLQAIELRLTKYLIKPIENTELIDAINLAKMELSEYSVIFKKTIYINDKYIWDIQNDILKYHSNEIRLTPKEKKILKCMFKNPSLVKTYDDIINYVWNEYEVGDKSSLKTMIMGLRKKLPENIITNIYGIGYKIVV